MICGDHSLANRTSIGCVGGVARDYESTPIQNTTRNFHFLAELGVRGTP